MTNFEEEFGGQTFTCRIFSRGRIGDLHFDEGVTTPGRTRKLMDPRFGSAR